MAVLETYLNGRSTALDPAARLGTAGVLVPLQAFCTLVGAEAKTLEEDGPLAVCRDDLCIPLNATGTDTVSIDGQVFAALDAFGAPLGLQWNVAGGQLQVTSNGVVSAGLGVGNVPPDFVLPDLYTGSPVSSRDYLGKKTVFYMWASW